MRKCIGFFMWGFKTKKAVLLRQPLLRCGLFKAYSDTSILSILSPARIASMTSKPSTTLPKQVC